MDKLPKTPTRIILYFLIPYCRLWVPLLIIWLVWSIDLSLRPYLIKVMLDKLGRAPDDTDSLFLLLLMPVSAYVAMSFLINLIFRLHDYLETKFLPPFNQHVFLKCLEQVQQHSYVFFKQNLGGTIVAKMSQFSDSVQEIIEIIIKRFFSNMFALIIACYTMATVHLLLALILLLWVFGFIFITYHFSKQARELSHKLSEQQTSLIGKVIDSISNMMIVRLFARQSYEYEHIANELGQKTQVAQQLRWNNLKRQALVEATSNILVVFLLIYLIYARQKGVVTIGDFSLILSLSVSIMRTIWHISQDFLNFSQNVGKLIQTTQLFNSLAPLPTATNGSLKVTKGQIEFRGVSFSYEESKPLFSDLNVTLHSQQKVGLVGFSGSGKTTFINLILRLLDPKNGTILIDDQNVNKIELESLYENITYIPQDPILFHRTIYDNIRYGNLEATEDEVKKAISDANAESFITELPEGYNTCVGERGGKLSGGQRQRIAIARAFLKNSKILVLDEPTSALDSLSEYYIQRSLDKLMENKTVLVIAHRLSTLINMDRILVFDSGLIVEDGNHAELLKKDRLYHKLWQQQMGTLV
ncbi:MAG: ABC transporter ATP-binding protein [Rickettsiaceae bacterium]